MTVQFVLSQSAAKKIALLRLESGCSEPVASLGEASQFAISKGPLADAIRGDAEDDALLKIARQELPLDELVYELIVVINEREDCRPEDLMVLDGIEFAMPDAIRQALSGYCLEFSTNGFELHRAGEVVKNLRGIEVNRSRGPASN